MFTPDGETKAAAARALNAARDGTTPDECDEFYWDYGEAL